MGLVLGAWAMCEEPTTAVIQRYLDALPGDASAGPAGRQPPPSTVTPVLLESVGRANRDPCGTLRAGKRGLHRRNLPGSGLGRDRGGVQPGRHEPHVDERKSVTNAA